MSDDAFAVLFAWARDREPATRDEIERDAHVVAEVAHAGPLRRDHLPAAIPAADRDRIHADVRAALVPGERVVHQAMRVIDLPSISVTYGMPTPEVPVEFLGLRLLAPPPVTPRAFQTRLDHLHRVFIASLVIPALLGCVYLARGAWFRSGYALAMTGSLLAAALLVYGWRWHATLGRRAARRWLLPALAPVAAAVVFASLGAPDLDHARAAIRAGQLEAAETELAALGDASHPRIAAAYADLNLARLRRTPSAHAAAALLAEIPTTAPQHAPAAAHVDTLVMAEAERLLQAGQLGAAESLLAQSSDASRSTSHGQALLARLHLETGRRCLEASQWDCAADRARRAPLGDPAAAALLADLRQRLRSRVDESTRTAARAKTASDRVAQLTVAESSLTTLERLSPRETPSAELLSLRAQLARAQTAVEDDRAKAARRAQAEEARRVRAEAAEERRSVRQPQRSCCKVCSSGCACGDSCISCSKVCRRGPGCAC